MEEEEDTARENPQGIDLTTRKDLRNRTTNIFVDTGSGDDFISEQFASSVINLSGYKPILNTESCLVCTAYGKDCTPCGNTYRVNVVITDDSQQKSVISLKVKALPIKHDIIMKYNTLLNNTIYYGDF